MRFLSTKSILFHLFEILLEVFSRNFLTFIVPGLLMMKYSEPITSDTPQCGEGGHPFIPE